VLQSSSIKKHFNYKATPQNMSLFSSMLIQFSSMCLFLQSSIMKCHLSLSSGSSFAISSESVSTVRSIVFSQY